MRRRTQDPSREQMGGKSLAFREETQEHGPHAVNPI